MVPPEKMPAPPRPVMARPRMNNNEDGATVQRTDPRAKMTNEVVKMVLIGKIVYSCPNTKMVETKARMLGSDGQPICFHVSILGWSCPATYYDIPYHPTSPIAWNSSLMTGASVATQLVSYQAFLSASMRDRDPRCKTHISHKEISHEDASIDDSKP